MVDIQIRPVTINDCQALAKVLISATQEAFRGRVPDACLQWISPEESAKNWAKNFKADGTLVNNASLFVATTASDDVIGLAMQTKISAQDKYPKQFTHELRTLQVAPTWQKQGVGRLLVASVAKEVWQQKGTHLLVKVLRENPNIGFYEHLGATFLEKRPYTWLDFQTEEFIYGWENIHKTFLTNSL